LIVIGTSALVVTRLHGTGTFGTLIAVLSVVIDGLMTTGLVLARKFLRDSICLRPGPNATTDRTAPTYPTLS